MQRRHFLTSALAAGIAAHIGRVPDPAHASGSGTSEQIPRREYRDGIQLSVIGFGGIVLLGQGQKEADETVAEVYHEGVNYFDVAPAYGDGEAEEKLGPALRPYREKVFLACKTGRRDARGAREELERSLKRLKTDHIDLYQFHAVTTGDDVNKIFAKGGALETFVRALEAGKIRYIGFSAHTEEAALALMDGFEFDSVLFPVNFVCFAEGNFGPKVLQRAKEKGIARLALKAMAYTPWPEGGEHTSPKCWYRPIEDRELASRALRFTLSQDVTAAIPPGDERLFRVARDAARAFTPMTKEEQAEMLSRAKGLSPLFKS